MRRAVCGLLCAALCLSLACGCMMSSSQDEIYSLYYREGALESVVGGDALRAETVYLPGREDPEALAEELMERLLAGPADETLRSTFPAGTVMISLDVNNRRAEVDMSPTYGTLSGVNLTLADYAIALTLTQIPGIDAVRITVRGRELAYREKQVFTEEDLLRSSMEDVVGTVRAELYFKDPAGHLKAEERELNLYEGDTQVGAVVKALAEGPVEKGLERSMLEGFEVKSAWLEENVCYVNLGSAGLKEMERGVALTRSAEALARSLCSLEAVSEVQFLVDGEFAAYYGTLKVDDPWSY